MIAVKKGEEPMCYLKCTKEAGKCGQLLSIYNPAQRASDHFKSAACKGVKQAQGQASPQFPLISKAAGRLLSAHVTSCATERNWSLFGNIFSKTRNRLALEHAQKMAYIRTNSSKGL